MHLQRQTDIVSPICEVSRFSRVKHNYFKDMTLVHGLFPHFKNSGLLWAGKIVFFVKIGKKSEIFKFCVKASEKSEGILNFTLGKPLDFGRKFHGSSG